jgi:hypothetical protein
MRTRLFTIAVACTVAVLFGAGNTRADDKAAVADEKALLKLEREWLDAEARHDVVALQSILDDNSLRPSELESCSIRTPL